MKNGHAPPEKERAPTKNQGARQRQLSGLNHSAFYHGPRAAIRLYGAVVGVVKRTEGHRATRIPPATPRIRISAKHACDCGGVPISRSALHPQEKVDG